jgi:hypothetical protein
MLFYRVEKDGKGPYHGCDLMGYLGDKGILPQGRIPKAYSKARPTPNDDKNLAPAWNALPDFMREIYVFGFQALDMVFSWFNLPEEVEFFRLNGYKLAVYETTEIIQGSKQAIAKKDALRLVEYREF